MDAVAGRGAAHALLLLVGLLALQGPARVQQPAVQLLLAPDGLLIEASALELARQLAGFLRERRSRGARPLRLEALELLGEGALAGGEGPQLLEHRLTARADQREQPLRLAVQPLLIARQPRELLHGFGEPAPRLRAAHLTAAAGQRERRGIQGVHRLLRQPRGLSGIHVRLLELRLRRRHLPFREAERPFELGGNERVLPSGLADLAAHGVGALLDRRLLRAGRRARLAAAQRLGHSLLALRQRGRLGQRAVERRERLRAPLLGERVPLAAQLVGHVLELLLGLLTGLLRLARLPVVRRPRGALHGGARVARRLRGPRQGWPGRAEILRDLVDPRRKRVGALRQGALARRRDAVGSRRVVAVPLALPALQVLRVGGQGGERPLRRRAPEQLLAALQLGLELLLRLGEPLERLARGLRIELRQRVLELAQPLLELRRHGALQQLLHLAQPRLERGVVDPGRACGARDLLDRP